MEETKEKEKRKKMNKIKGSLKIFSMTLASKTSNHCTIVFDENMKKGFFGVQ